MSLQSPAATASSSPEANSLVQQRYACSLCARRKVKCNRLVPCSNCQKSRQECVYESPALHRPRKRAADEDLLARLANYEELMKKHEIDFSQHANTWVSSGLETKIIETKIKDLDVGESPASIGTDSTAVNSGAQPVSGFEK